MAHLSSALISVVMSGPGHRPLGLLVTMETVNSMVCFCSTLWDRCIEMILTKCLKSGVEGEGIHTRDSLSSICVFRSHLSEFNLKSISSVFPTILYAIYHTDIISFLFTPVRRTLFSATEP